MNRRQRTPGRRFLGTLAMALVVLLALAAAAQAAPSWRLESLADASVAPGESFEYMVQATNQGDEAMSGPIELTALMPAGIEALSATLYLDPLEDNPDTPNTIGCETTPGSVRCENAYPLAGHGKYQLLRLQARAEPGVAGTLTASFAVSGGGAGSVSTVDPTRISSEPPAFGLDTVDGLLSDPAGNPVTQAGAHPALDAVTVDYNTYTNPLPVAGAAWPVEPVRDVTVELPPGLVGDPTAIPTCSAGELLGVGNIGGLTKCPPSAQVGTVMVRTNNFPLAQPLLGPFPLFNMEPPADAPARLGFNVSGTLVILDATVRSGSDYGITLKAEQAPEIVPVAGTTVTVWGMPADPAHDGERACAEKLGVQSLPAFGGPSCPSSTPPTAFLRTPTSCAGAPETVVSADSWIHPGAFDTDSFKAHLLPAYPAAPQDRGAAQGMTGCDKVPFDPSLVGQPVEHGANTPSGFAFDLSLPQSSDPTQIAESDLRKAVVTLPEGVRVNPSAADGLQGCSQAQIHLHDAAPPSCPEASKVGSVGVKSPLLKNPLQGGIYLASPHDNPFGSLLAIYLVAEGSGVVVKLAGKVEADPATGQLRTTFDENPQTPFSSVHLQFDGGPRAQLVTPKRCGTYTTESVLTGWNGKVVTVRSPFTIDQGCSAPGFDPKLSAGVERAIAGQTSPFTLRLTRSDSDQDLSGLTVKMPPGLTGYLKGIPYCPEAALASISGDEGTGVAQIASPSCPAASGVGTTVVGAGAGSNPFYDKTGKVYLAGPYKGAPLSVAVVTPAVAGPFDLGTVAVRAALRVDPESAQITAASDPLPTILHGIPLDLRDVRVELDRDRFVLNPTDCDPLQVGATVTSTEGAVATPSQRFQVGDCGSLAFKPALSLRLSGQTKRGGNPAVKATLRMPKGQNANIAKVQVSLPHSEFIAQSHLADICTRVQYAAAGGGGAGCPAKSVYGHARAFSPLLDQPLEGPVYLRSNGGERTLPDLVASLGGQIHIDAVGYIGANKRTGGLRTTFATVPDAPIEKVVISLPAGRHSLLENSTDICRGRRHAIVRMSAHDEATAGTRTPLQVACGGKKKGRGGRR